MVTIKVLRLVGAERDMYNGSQEIAVQAYVAERVCLVRKTHLE